jgi:hypothetical protein
MELMPNALPALKAPHAPPIYREMDPVPARGLAAVAMLAAVFAGTRLLGHGRAAASGAPPITASVRRAGLRFDPSVAPADQAWIRAALAGARPEAAVLIDAVDGLVTVSTVSEPRTGIIGSTQRVGGRYAVAFNLAYLDADRTIDRDTTVLHEFGHVVDFALVPDGLRDRLAAELPRVGDCRTADSGDCTVPAERFADTFAKWALRGAVSAVGAGYGVPAPASLEDWGAPLAALAVQVDIATR